MEVVQNQMLDQQNQVMWKKKNLNFLIEWTFGLSFWLVPLFLLPVVNLFLFLV